jgi:dTDP-4-amino-4,6-dideoxygalactose transaminase
VLPRKKLDIGWADLSYGLAACLLKKDRKAAQARLEKLWSSEANALATLSVRSGFDLLLQCLALPRDSEILVSAITIRDMVRIIERHGLRAVPVDIDPATCVLRCDLLAQAITPRSKAILVAHLFGSRMGMEDITEIAQRHNLYVFEDCAQAFAADGYRGHPGSDVAMFSFGPIKTATALGGALFSFRDSMLCGSVKTLQREYPVQSRKLFFRRVLKYSLLKALSCRLPYSLFAASCKLLRTTHDRIISDAVRGFAGGDLLSKIRYQSSYALLALLERRLRRYTPEHLRPRIDATRLASSYLPGISIIGRHARNHSHWVFPIRSKQPDRLVRHLWGEGFDATRGASSLYAVPAAGDSGTDAAEARRMIDQVVYLPVDSGARVADLRRLAEAVLCFEAPDPSSDADPQDHADLVDTGLGGEAISRALPPTRR